MTLTTEFQIALDILFTQVGRIYDLTAFDFPLPNFIFTSVGTPFIAAVVAVPILNECVLKPFGFQPSRFAAFLRMA